MQNESILWYDLETFGVHSQYDRIAQYASIRTDIELNIIGDPLILYCRLSDDYLPDPLACLVTGITPQEVNEKGIPEKLFIERILEEFMVPGTCVAGYNSIKFDDEFIRNALYRNFFDPYEREYANGNSRWDVIDVVRAAHDLRPEGIHWIRNDEGKPSFRLEKLTEANGIKHSDAHDALADVRATIDLARLLRDAQPRFFYYAFSHRLKSQLKNKINLYKPVPILHTSAVHTNPYGCTAMLLPLSVDPRNSNTIICFNLANDPEKLITTPAEKLLGPDIPLTRIALNRAPFIAPMGTLSEEAAKRLHIDVDKNMRHCARILERHDLAVKIRSAMEKITLEGPSDPDFQIYSGGFFSDSDRDRFQIIHNTPAAELPTLRLNFQDPRVPEMLWRYTARNFPDALDDDNRRRWKSFAASRILFPPGKIMINLQFYRRKIQEKTESHECSAEDKLILRKLADYADYLEAKLFQKEKSPDIPGGN